MPLVTICWISVRLYFILLVSSHSRSYVVFISVGAAVCNKYNIPSSEFACQIEAFLINVSSSSLSLEQFGKLEAEIHKSKFQPSMFLPSRR